MLSSLQQLSHQEKIRAIQFLTIELAKEDQNMNLIEGGKTYEVWSPYDAFSAEKVLADMLKQHNSHWIFRILSSDVKLKRTLLVARKP
jgi:hypothetical protein